MPTPRSGSLLALVLLAAFAVSGAAPSRAAGARIVVTYGDGLIADGGPQDGRLLLLFSTDKTAEPRFQISDTSLNSQQVFAIDVDGWKTGQEAVVPSDVLGYPLERLSEVPAGTYQVQALLHRYETFHRSDGHVVKLPPDRGEGQQWSKAPGNLYSTPREIVYDPAKGATIRIVLDKVIPPIPDPPETKYVKHEKIVSQILSKFWGRKVYLGAHVLLPEGFDAHPEARYPLVIFHGHFPDTITGWREEPPDPNLAPDYSDRFHLSGYNRIQQEEAYQFSKDWKAPGYPRYLVVEIQHANPFYDDSYAVNSQNLGPYGDAITYELIPYLEKKYRAIGAGWARFLYGGSTGGWESLGAQIFYPDEYNGAWAACPDPIDFHQYGVVNIYEDANAYEWKGPWKVVATPGHRDYLGHISSTVEQMNRLELVVGPRTRSGGQYDIWQAVYSPVGIGRIPEADLGQAYRRHRQGGCGVLEGELRPREHPEARLEQGPRPKARRQAPHLRRRGGQLLPEQRGLSRRAVPQEHEGSVLRRRSGLRAARGALLERRPHAPQRRLAPALPPDVRAEDRRANREVRAARRRPEELAVLIRGAPSPRP